MKVNICLLPLCVVGLLASTIPPNSALSREFIDEINAQATTWTAGENFHPSTSMESLRRLVGSLPSSKKFHLPKRTFLASEIEELPKNFDSREQWPDCPSIKEIYDQGCCGSCWAFGTVETISDRICVASNGKSKVRISARDLMTCCKNCGLGCKGGLPSLAFKYWRDVGIVSGGPYNSSNGCQPYSVPPFDVNNCKRDDDPTPPCSHQCRKGYQKNYSEDLHRGSHIYRFYPTQVETMMQDIIKHGPLQATFDVYLDFYSYKSGIYQHTKGELVGLHAIKIIGFGEENGIKYWLCANSWGTKWGEKGFFRILRGEDHCGIEWIVHGGIPIIS